MQLVSELLLKPPDTLYAQVDMLNICMEKFDAKGFELSHFLTLLLNKDFVIAQIVHAQGNQLVPELLLMPSDTLRAQCRQTEHLHEEV